jgi:hypothetical protein
VEVNNQPGESGERWRDGDGEREREKTDNTNKLFLPPALSLSVSPSLPLSI